MPGRSVRRAQCACNPLHIMTAATTYTMCFLSQTGCSVRPDTVFRNGFFFFFIREFMILYIPVCVYISIFFFFLLILGIKYSTVYPVRCRKHIIIIYNNGNGLSPIILLLYHFCRRSSLRSGYCLNIAAHYAGHRAKKSVT